MNVKFISETTTEIKGKDNRKLKPEELIVYIARVSNPKNKNNSKTAPKLIKYLIENSHWSPFEMVDMTVEIETSRAIAAQLLRHRSFSFQEFSQRYSNIEEQETFFQTIDIRKKAEKNRQSSSEQIDPEIGHANASTLIEHHLNSSLLLYQELIDHGVATEVARMVLPLDTTTTLYMKGTLRSWITFLNVRLHHHAQLEAREIAQEISKIIIKRYPNISKALNNFENWDNEYGLTI